MSVDTVKPLTNPMTMKIIASSAVPTGAETEKVLQIANDAELADIAASGALQGVARVELNFPKFTDAAPSARPCCCAAATALQATSAPRATC